MWRRERAQDQDDEKNHINSTIQPLTKLDTELVFLSLGDIQVKEASTCMAYISNSIIDYIASIFFHQIPFTKVTEIK